MAFQRESNIHFGCLAFQRPNKILHYSLDMGKMVLHFLKVALADVGRLLATSLRFVVSELTQRGCALRALCSHLLRQPPSV